MKSGFVIEIAPTGFESLEEIKDRKRQGEVARAIDGLADDPEGQGKALVHPLEGLRSIRAARERYRILYRVDREKRKVSVLLVGPRRAGEEADVYAVARKLLRTLLGES